MPLYEYSCIACDTITDIRHGFDEKNTEVCPKCGGELKRKFSASGIVFKGSGFYVNDSRTQSSSASSSAASTEAAAPDQAPSSSSDASAPAATPSAPAASASPPPSGSTTNAPSPASGA